MIFDRWVFRPIMTKLNNYLKLIIQNIFKLYTGSVIVNYIECGFRDTSPELKQQMHDFPMYYNMIPRQGCRWYIREAWQGNIKTKNQIHLYIPIITDIVI